MTTLDPKGEPVARRARGPPWGSDTNARRAERFGSSQA